MPTPAPQPVLTPADARIVFAGTPEFAAAHLKALLDAGIRPVAVYTQPDRPAGRGQQLQASPVKQLAVAAGIPALQPENFRAEADRERLRALAPDLFIVVAYGLLLPQAVLDIPRLGCINVHGSLLPRWRGAAPIQRAVQAGDAETGVQLMRMEIGLDTGPVLAEARTPISASDTGGSVHDRLAALGAGLLVEKLPALLRGELPAQVQDNSRATYAHKLHKDEARLDWSQPATVIDRLVRAFNPWPVTQTTLAGETLKIWQAGPLATAHQHAPGSILARHDQSFDVACGEGALRVHAVQLPGGKRLAVKDLFNAAARREQFAAGVRLGA